MENTKNAVSIEVLLKIMEDEVERAKDSMFRKEKIFNSMDSNKGFDKKMISFF